MSSSRLRPIQSPSTTWAVTEAVEPVNGIRPVAREQDDTFVMRRVELRQHPSDGPDLDPPIPNVTLAAVAVRHEREGVVRERNAGGCD